MSGRRLELSGSSVAGVETAIEVPSLGLVLDMGRCSRSAVNQPLVLVSHGHLDHAGAITQHAARRAMMKMSPGIYLVPRPIHEDVERLFNAAGTLDGNPIARRVQPLAPGENFAISERLHVRPFATFHRVPSQGYGVWERRHRLRAEFHGLPGAELAKLRAQGATLDETYETLLLAFTGDTRSEVLQVPELSRAETLVIETSFLDQRVSVADARVMGHIHLDELVEQHALLPQRDVVFSHFSARYAPHEIEPLLTRRLPETLRPRVRVLC